MSFRTTISWLLFPLTMWYAVGTWFRNLLFDIGLKKQHAPHVTTIGVGNICAGGTGKTPHAEYLLQMLSDRYRTAMLSRGYKRKSSGFVLDDGSHLASRLGDEPAMVAYKHPKVQVAVCEKRVVGIGKLMEQSKPQVVVLDDVFQHRHIKPTISILLTEYGNPFYRDHVMPYGNLRESRSARYRANIVIVTKSPAQLNPIDRHNIVQELGLRPFQKVFFSTIRYCDPVPLLGGKSLPLTDFDHVLLVTGIAHPESLQQHVAQSCQVTSLTFNDHHNYSNGDIKRIRKAFDQMPGSRKVILTTEKDAARLREMAGREVMAGLPIYALPIAVEILPNKDYDFDQTILNLVNDNILFLDKMSKTKFDW